nr:hypothetical protein [Tanacetum cinerariifolium]
MLGSMSPELSRTLKNYNAYDMIQELKTMFEEQAKQELFETVKAFHTCKQEDGQLVSSYLLKMKSYLNTFECLGYAMPKELGKKAIRSDRRGEYLSREFVNRMKSCSIVSKLTAPYTSQHNRVSERRNRTLLDMVRSMINLTTLPKSFWGYALETAARILNMVPTKKVDRTPYEIWLGKAPELSYLRVWGCEALVKRDTSDKLDSRSIKCIFVVQKASGSYGFLEMSGSDKGLEIIQEEDTQPSENTSEEHNDVAPIKVEPQNVRVPIRRSARIPQVPNRYGYYVDVEEYELGDLDEPPNYKAALADPESDKWLEAMNTEMQSMKDNQVWYLVDLPSNGLTVGCKWLFKENTNMDGNDREGDAAKQSGDDAPIKRRSINEGEAAAERVSNDSEEIARVLTSIDAATVLAGGIDVPTGSGFIPTAGPPATVISTGSEIRTGQPLLSPPPCLMIQHQGLLPLLLMRAAQEEEIGILKERVQVLEDREAVATKQSGEDAPIKGRSPNEGEAAAKRISNDSEEIAKVLTSMDATTILAGETDVPTGSGFIPTASPPATVISTGSEVGPTASPIVTRRKGKEVMIARDAEVERIYAEEELHGMIDSLDKSNETIAKYLHEYQEFASELPLEKKIELISDLVKYQEHYTKVEDFIPMGSEEESERLKRKGLNLEKEQVKKQKSSDEPPEIETITKE